MNPQPPGWFGKISSLGDFAHRRLSPLWIESCDRWLSAALRDAKADLGTRWLDIYLTAPILRFAWGSGVVDRDGWVGVLMPSCDNVGRYFPLLIAEALPMSVADGWVVDPVDPWYAEVSRIAMATLDDVGTSVDAIEAALAGLPPFRSAADPGQAAPTFHMPPTGRSAWWTVDDERATPIELIDGLPDGARFARLLVNERSLLAGHP